MSEENNFMKGAFNRIKMVKDYFNKNNNLFAQELEVSNSTISNIFSGKTNPTLEFMYKIINAYPQISKSWLFFNEGEMLEDTNISLEKETVVALSDKKIRDSLDNIEKNMLSFFSQKHVEEIRVFYSDGSYDVFLKNLK